VIAAQQDAVAKHPSLPLTARLAAKTAASAAPVLVDLVMLYKHCPRIGYYGIRRSSTHNPVSDGIVMRPTKKPRRNAALSQQ
jgi:hypothetical protein